MTEAATLTTPQSERVAQIVKAAATVMGRQGYANTSMKDIAAEAGIAQGLIHYYFGSKEELLVEVVRSIHQEMVEDQRQLRDRIKDKAPLEQIWASLELARTKCSAQPEFFRLFYDLVNLGFSNPAMHVKVQELYEDVTDTVAEQVTAIVNTLPTPLPVDIRDFAKVFVAAVDGLALRSLIDPDGDQEASFRALGFLAITSAAISYVLAGEVPPLDQMLSTVVGEPTD